MNMHLWRADSEKLLQEKGVSVETFKYLPIMLILFMII